MPEGTLEVVLVGASGLRTNHSFGTLNLYAVLKCGALTHRSGTATAGGTAVEWDQAFSFEVPDGVSDLCILLYDKEPHTSIGVMGSVLIPLEYLFLHHEIPESKHEVKSPAGQIQGEVTVRLQFSPKVYHGSLVVHLLEAHGLIDSVNFDKSDPYAILTCNKQTLRSETKHNAGGDPVWDDFFVFEINSDATELLVEIFDHDTFSADDPLGSAVVPLQNVFKKGFVEPGGYKVYGNDGKPHGEVVIGLRLISRAEGTIGS